MRSIAAANMHAVALFAAILMHALPHQVEAQRLSTRVVYESTLVPDKPNTLYFFLESDTQLLRAGSGILITGLFGARGATPKTEEQLASSTFATRAQPVAISGAFSGKFDGDAMFVECPTRPCNATDGGNLYLKIRSDLSPNRFASLAFSITLTNPPQTQSLPRPRVAACNEPSSSMENHVASCSANRLFSASDFTGHNIFTAVAPTKRSVIPNSALASVSLTNVVTGNPSGELLRVGPLPLEQRLNEYSFELDPEPPELPDFVTTGATLRTPIYTLGGVDTEGASLQDVDGTGWAAPAETTVAMRILFEASSNTRRDSRMAWYNEATSAWVFENSIAVQPDIVSGVPTLRIRALRLYKHVAVFERFQTLGDAAFRTPFLEETTQFHRVLNTLTLSFRMNQPNNALRLSPGTTITLRGMTEADVPSGELTLVRDIAGRRPSSGPDSEGEQLQFMAFGGRAAWDSVRGLLVLTVPNDVTIPFYEVAPTVPRELLVEVVFRLRNGARVRPAPLLEVVGRNAGQGYNLGPTAVGGGAMSYGSAMQFTRFDCSEDNNNFGQQNNITLFFSINYIIPEGTRITVSGLGPVKNPPGMYTLFGSSAGRFGRQFEYNAYCNGAAGGGQVAGEVRITPTIDLQADTSVNLLVPLNNLFAPNDGAIPTLDAQYPAEDQFGPKIYRFESENCSSGTVLETVWNLPTPIPREVLIDTRVENTVALSNGDKVVIPAEAFPNDVYPLVSIVPSVFKNTRVDPCPYTDLNDPALIGCSRLIAAGPVQLGPSPIRFREGGANLSLVVQNKFTSSAELIFHRLEGADANSWTPLEGTELSPDGQTASIRLDSFSTYALLEVVRSVDRYRAERDGSMYSENDRLLMAVLIPILICLCLLCCWCGSFILKRMSKHHGFEQKMEVMTLADLHLLDQTTKNRRGERNEAELFDDGLPPNASQDIMNTSHQFQKKAKDEGKEEELKKRDNLADVPHWLESAMARRKRLEEGVKSKDEEGEEGEDGEKKAKRGKDGLYALEDVKMWQEQQRLKKVGEDQPSVQLMHARELSKEIRDASQIKVSASVGKGDPFNQFLDPDNLIDEEGTLSGQAGDVKVKQAGWGLPGQAQPASISAQAPTVQTGGLAPGQSSQLNKAREIAERIRASANPSPAGHTLPHPSARRERAGSTLVAEGAQRERAGSTVTAEGASAMGGSVVAGSDEHVSVPDMSPEGVVVI